VLDPMMPSTLARHRQELAEKIDADLGPFDPLLLEAIRVVPRERFVREGDEERSSEDVPLPLDDDGLATVSAPHAYCLSYRLLALRPGDTLIELGTGTGYGAALASFIVGPSGRVLTIEIDVALYGRARTLLAPLSNVTLVHRDAIESAPLWSDAGAGAAGGTRAVCTFALERLPQPWLAALPDGGVLVAPVASGRAGGRDQILVRVTRQDGTLRITNHDPVRYVRNRGRAASLT
jgi:protein-L-isoaspartate(D-aspartate) O-methyltransferase